VKDKVLEEIDKVIDSLGENEEKITEIVQSVTDANDKELDKLHVAGIALVARALNNLARAQLIATKVALQKKED